jgi:hypothetical protein
VLQVGAEHVTRLDMIPDIDASSMRVTVRGSPSAVGLPVVVQLGNNGTAVSGASALKMLAGLWVSACPPVSVHADPQ